MTQANDKLEDTATNMKTEEQAEVQTVAKPDDATKDNTTGTKNTLPAAPPPASENNQELSTKGTLRTKTYTLKKKTNTKRRSFKCSECDVIKKSIRKLNIHHEECHNPHYVASVGNYLNSLRALQGTCMNIINPSTTATSATTPVSLKVNYRPIKSCTERTHCTSV